MAIDAEDVFNNTMTPAELAESDRRVAQIETEWQTMRSRLPTEVVARLDEKKARRRSGAQATRS